MAERVECLYRVSTTKQVDHDDRNQADIPVQRKACREFAEKMGWTIVGEEQENGASDSARYRALGNSVTIPCVEYIMRGLAMVADITGDRASSRSHGR